ncbi:hypothetical protein OXV40_33275, partial [Burkholderia contaminans]|uniref:hypothetical protein n=1 Tax=Burkholderia contaminans TaxID=488447 RepID=UPI002D7ED3CF
AAATSSATPVNVHGITEATYLRMILFMRPHDIDVGTDMRISGLPQDPRQGFLSTRRRAH